MSPSPARITIPERVQWSDTDAAGIYHWGTLVRFADAAEAALHTALGIVAETFGSTPRLSATFTFHRPLRFNDRAWVTLEVTSVGRSSVGYRLAVAGAAGEPVADGEIVACLVAPGGERSVPWPEPVRRALAEGGEQPAAVSVGGETGSPAPPADPAT